MNMQKITYKDSGETIYKGEHASGLTVYVMPKPGFDKSYAIYATRYGSINRTFIPAGDDKEIVVPDGVAHFLEHKMFEEPDGTNVFDEFAKYGANANAFTSFVMTAYLFSSSDYFYENLKTLLGYTQRPYFTDENVEKEKGIIGQEIRMYNDDPDWNVYFNAIKAMYKNHPVNIDIAGTVESISEIDKEVLYRCYNTFYHPSNMVLFTVGNITPDKVDEIVEQLVKQSRPAGTIRQTFPFEPTEITKAEITQYFSIGMPQFVIAFKDKTLPKDADDFMWRDATTSILLEILAGRSSALYKKLYEEGLVSASFSADYEGELSFSFCAFSGESKDPKLVQKIIFDELERIKTDGIAEEAFIRAKRVCYGRMMRLLDRQESFANSFVGFALKGADLLKYPSIVLSVTIKDLEERLSVFDKNQCVISLALPKEE